MENSLVLNIKDNIVNAVEDIKKGTNIAFKIENDDIKIIALDDIPFGFKAAIKPIKKGEPIIKYGEIIGRSKSDIKQGQLVHVHNMEGNRGRGDLE